VPELLVIDELRAYLIAQGVCQTNDAAVAAPSAVIPSIWVKPMTPGAPEPRLPEGGEVATITLADTLLKSPGDLEPWMEEAFIEVIVRSWSPSAGELIQRQIRGLIVPDGAVGGRKMWTLNTLLVEYSTLWRGDQSLGATDLSYGRTQSFRFGARRKSLSGLPYVP
jgi:hypothetical protein